MHACAAWGPLLGVISHEECMAPQSECPEPADRFSSLLLCYRFDVTVSRNSLHWLHAAVSVFRTRHHSSLLCRANKFRGVFHSCCFQSTHLRLASATGGSFTVQFHCTCALLERLCTHAMAALMVTDRAQSSAQPWLPCCCSQFEFADVGVRLGLGCISRRFVVQC